MHRQFDQFEEVEADIVENAPAVVYKYRTWQDANHKRLLTNQEIWFSHPFKLNDPLDVRSETVFNEQEFHEPRYFQKLLATVGEQHPDLVSDYDRKIVAENQWELTKQKPTMITENLKNWNSVEGHFDPYGVFSTSMDELNEKTWHEYGQQNGGYCVGFATVELCKQMLCGFGYVTYSDAPYAYSFFKEIEERDLDALYLKKIVWEYEKEFRFITVRVGNGFERLQVFNMAAVKEIILGYNISAKDEEEIMKEIEGKYPKQVPVYKTARGGSNLLTKIKIR